MSSDADGIVESTDSEDVDVLSRVRKALGAHATSNTSFLVVAVDDSGLHIWSDVDDTAELLTDLARMVEPVQFDHPEQGPGTRTKALH